MDRWLRAYERKVLSESDPQRALAEAEEDLETTAAQLEELLATKGQSYLSMRTELLVARGKISRLEAQISTMQKKNRAALAADRGED